jgi:hypothetical protein
MQPSGNCDHLGINRLDNGTFRSAPSARASGGREADRLEGPPVFGGSPLRWRTERGQTAGQSLG